MGNAQPRNNANLQHLTNDPSYQQVLRELYANNPPQILQDYPQYLANQDQHPQRYRQNVEIKKVTPLANDTYIHKNSISLIQVDASTFDLQFVYDSQHEVNIHVYYIAKESVNTTFITQEIDALDKSEFKGIAGQKQVFKESQLDIRKYQIEIEHFHQQYQWYTLQTMQITPEKQLYQYCSLKITQEDIKVLTIDVKIQKHNKAYIAKDVYGGQKELDDKECVVCMTAERNTLILPCKHMCLCQICCTGLLSRAPKCPICRNRITGFRMIVKEQRKE